MIERVKLDKKYIRYGLYVVIVGLLLFLGYRIINNGELILSSIGKYVGRFFRIIAPVFYGFIVSYLLFRPVVFIQSVLGSIYTKISKRAASENIENGFRIISIVSIFAVIIYVAVITINFIVPPIVENIEILLSRLPEFNNQISTWVEDIVEKLNENNIDISNTGNLTSTIINNLSLISNSVLSFIATSISQISSFVLDFVLTVILTFYFLKDKESLFHNFRGFRDVVMPGKVGKAITIFLKDLDEIVGKFLVAEILDSIIVGIVSTILLLLINHPFAILIGCVAGFANIIPYIGPLIGAALALGLGMFSSWSLGITGAVLLLLYQQVDGNFVQPKIVGDKIGLTPVWILIVVLIGGSYFGALGMILSMPIAGLIKIYFNRYAQWKKNKNI
ncbi:AI-2E family transporter [Clostridium frigidicarnis]|uniref:Predicted PurR-regulated permease PerM n=1 Tax=Clostridium frigidicarnis TaxID=84698 RepID=A0A1I0X2A5_9CLOT|nr:AI-2E family transporter [Clostridium frigidicarnis]SFA95129.1 Predicted PurR-regulated permease PerM [Clostridium frigidicarnis]